MGLMALVIVVSGTAVASSGHHSAEAAKKKRTAITTSSVRRLADAEIKKLAPTLSVASAKSATNATNATTATTADRATNATNATRATTADSATNATRATTADSAKIAVNVLSANVNAAGVMLGSIPPGATATKQGLPGTGTYLVKFGRDITGCTITTGAANAQGPQVAFTAVGVDDSTTLRVFTRDPTNTVADEPFYIQAICPS
jgi:hypothetical protein